MGRPSSQTFQAKRVGPVNGLVPRVSRDAARQKLSRRGLAERLSWLWRLPAAFKAVDTTPQQNGLPRLETVWLPTYRVTFARGGAAQAATFDALVNGHTGHTVIFDLTGNEWTVLEDQYVTEPDVSAERALELARAAVARAQLSRPGWGRRESADVQGDCDLIGYPIWAYYFLSHAGMLDAKLLDALTGAPGGARLMTALLATLAGRQGS